MMRDGDLATGNPFVMIATNQGGLVIPRWLSGGDLEVIRGSCNGADCGAIVLSGGFVGFDPSKLEEELFDQTGIITRMGNAGTEFCERVIVACGGSRAEIVLPAWNWIDANWPIKMTAAGFDVSVTRQGPAFALAEGAANGLNGVRWLEGAFYGISPLAVLYQGSGSCPYFDALKVALADGEDLHPLHNREPGTVSVVGTFSELFTGAYMVAAFGGPDVNNLTLTFLDGYTEAISRIRAALPEICRSLGLRLFDAGNVIEGGASYGSMVDFSTFLLWVPCPLHWHEISLALEQ